MLKNWYVGIKPSKNMAASGERPLCQMEEVPFDRLFDRVMYSFPVRAAKYAIHKIRHGVFHIFSAQKVKVKEDQQSPEPESLSLQPGELVEVLSFEEIRKTLDHRDKSKGLTFMPEMRRYCGRRFKVLKRVDKYIVEGKGMIRLKNTVILDGVFCNGEFHGGCDRTCFCLWREAWIKRV
jgi:hypothetical protein